MKRETISTITVWGVIALAMGGAFFSLSAALALPPPAAKDGKAIFLGEKCQECHAMSALGIKKEVGPDTEDVDAPDLSAVGLKRTPEWIGKWLNKQETIDGKKHDKKFKGSAEDVKTISEWLATQKASKKK
jgi:mono/diheme cytochrome c family protein